MAATPSKQGREGGRDQEAKAESGKKLQVLRTDHGGEFTLMEFVEYCVDCGVVRHLTATECGCGTTELGHRRHGPKHDEGEVDANRVMG